MAQDFVLLQAYWGNTFEASLARSTTDRASGAFDWLDMNAALAALCSSSYFSALEQYGAGRVLLGGPAVSLRTGVIDSGPPAQWRDGQQAHGFQERDIENFLVKQIDEGQLDPPNQWQDRGLMPIYLVVLPQGLYSRDHFNAAVGLHWHFTYRGQQAICAWNMQGDSLDDTTKIVTHEIVEAIASELGAGEISDDCLDSLGDVNRVAVQGYKSAQDGGTCVIPGQRFIHIDRERQSQRLGG